MNTQTRRQSRHLGWLIVLAVVAAAPAAFAEPPDLSGVWLWGGEVGGTKMILTQREYHLEGRIETASGDQSWEVVGDVSDAGEVMLVRRIPKTELGNTPAPVLADVMRKYADTTKPDMLRGTVKMTYDAAKGELKGQYNRINPFYMGNTLLQVKEVWDDLNFRRAPKIPDLVVTRFAIDYEAPPRGTADNGPWSIKVEIENAGYADMTERFGFTLKKLGQYGTPQLETEFRGVAYASNTHPGLKMGEKTTVEWRTDKPTPTANRPNVTDNDLALRVVLDHEEKLQELSEENNEATLWKVTCEDKGPAGAGRGVSAWVESSEAGYGETPDYAAVLDRMYSKERAVLCYIKMEARRRTKSTPGSVAGSKMLAALQTHFLKDYLASPSTTTGKAAIDLIGEHQGAPSVSSKLGAAEYVPKIVQSNHAGTPEWLYPATHFWIIGGNRGKNVNRIRLLDVPFLVGDENDSLVEDADFVGGGKNLSNVMHWATGVKHAHVPRDAMRELFIGYELWHLEGWDKFGEDAINDLISEEQGRIFGKSLKDGSANSTNLVKKLDEAFLESRAWVGALLALRREDFDKLILAEAPGKSNMWWGGLPASYVAPWDKDKSVKKLLASGKKPSEVARSGLAEQLVQIYTLIYETEEWQRRTGRSTGVTNLQRRIIQGRYDSQFKSAPKQHGDTWELTD